VYSYIKEELGAAAEVMRELTAAAEKGEVNERAAAEKARADAAVAAAEVAAAKWRARIAAAKAGEADDDDDDAAADVETGQAVEIVQRENDATAATNNPLYDEPKEDAGVEMNGGHKSSSSIVGYFFGGKKKGRKARDSHDSRDPQIKAASLPLLRDIDDDADDTQVGLSLFTRVILQ
jgi:hypothetical protein